MGKNAMAGAVTLCGIGLCTIGGALLMQSGGQAHAVGGVMPAAAMLASAANAQAGPTVVWYDAYQWYNGGNVILRAWSDGTIEARNWRLGDQSYCYNGSTCIGAWFTISSPTEGYRAAADINADERVDGADLTSILGSWGDAPRVPFPPSNCPLNLINP